jgi:predicted membrane-bound mannosyltransferase
MVFYSRYYIHETALVLFSFLLLVAAHSYLDTRSPGVALLGGLSLGLMLATKETAVLALCALASAFVLSALGARGPAGPPTGTAFRGRDLLAALASAGAAWMTLVSSFFSNPRGVVDSVRTFGLYLERAGDASVHVHPWDYYLRLLIHFPAEGTPFWTEGLIVGLAILGGATGWKPAASEADPRFLRVLAFYTLILLALYSAIPYKTPWCLLGFLHGMILLAGVGAVSLARACSGRGSRAVVMALATGAVAHLGWQAYSASFRFAADPRNPYVYAHTGTDVFEIVRRLEGVARAHPDRLAMPVQIMSGTNLWPLPFYLRAFTGVAWWTGVPEEARSAPVIVATPDLEEALVTMLYDRPPPGERELYVGLFDRPLYLRPGVELRGYVRQTLGEDFRRAEAAPPEPTR